MQKMKATERIGVRVSPELKRRIENRAAEEGRPMSNFVVKVLEDYLNKIDDAKNLLK